MARILVTGGAGFIGSNLANELSKNHKVIVIDNLFLGDPKNLEKRVKFYKMDTRELKIINEGFVAPRLRDDGYILEVPVFRKFDYIFHFGNASSAPMYENDLKFSWQMTVDGFIEILKFAEINKVKKLIYASTSSIYGPETYYTTAFKTMEHLANLSPLETIGLRFFSVYGPNETHKGKYANVVTQFLWCMSKGRRPVIYGDGSQTRDFIYVGDVVRACILAMKKGRKGVYDIGTGKSYTFNEVVDLLNFKLGKKIKPKYVPNPINRYVYHTLCKDFSARDVFGFEPKVDLEEGIDKIISFYLG